jgi:tetratricopeptide (TPR) repeat protein
MFTRLAAASIFLMLVSFPCLTPAATADPARAEHITAAVSDEEKALAAQAQDAARKKNWARCEELFNRLVLMSPAKWQYFNGLGNAQQSQGKLEEALRSYDKGMESTGITPERPGRAGETGTRNDAVNQLLTGKATVYLKLHKSDEAYRALSQAAAVSPNPAEAYLSLCSLCYKTGDMVNVVPACDLAVTADPKNPEAYFIKGSALFGNSRRDKDRRLVVPPGTVEALQKYLELAPQGPYAYDVRYMLKDAGIK